MSATTPPRPRRPAGPGPLARFDELLGRPVSMRALALLRVLVGPLVLLHLEPIVREAVAGHTYHGVFHEPYAAWYPQVGPGPYTALLWVAAGAAVLLSLGLFTRLAAVVTAAIVTWNVFLSTTHFHNNRAYLVIVLWALVVAPCGRELSFDAWQRRRRGEQPLPRAAPGWPLWLLRFEASVVYGASAVSKLLDPDWFGGLVTWDRVVRVQDRIVSESPLPMWFVDVLTNRTFHTYAAKVIVLTELFIALGLWWRRTRYAAVWVAVVFHVSVELSATVQVFSYLALAALVIWSVPSTRDRVLWIDPGCRRHRRFAVAVGALDWLARFQVASAPGGASLEVVDRDGTSRRGAGAVAFTLSRLPLTAWFALPVLLLPAIRRRAVPPPGAAPFDVAAMSP